MRNRSNTTNYIISNTCSISISCYTNNRTCGYITPNRNTIFPNKNFIVCCGNRYKRCNSSIRLIRNTSSNTSTNISRYTCCVGISSNTSISSITRSCRYSSIIGISRYTCSIGIVSSTTNRTRTHTTPIRSRTTPKKNFIIFCGIRYKRCNSSIILINNTRTTTKIGRYTRR